MQTKRLSLSSSVFADRIKKYDTYQHDPRTSQRASLKVAKTPNPRNVNKNPVRKKSDVSRTNTISIPKKQKPTRPIKSLSTNKLALNAVAKSVPSKKLVLSNQFHDFTPPKKTKDNKKTRILVYSFGTFLFLLSSFATFQTILTNRGAQAQIEVLGETTYTKDAQGVVEGTGSNPAENEVSSEARTNYQVNPELPRYISIPEIRVFARVKHTGVDKEGLIDAPANIHDASWFNGSALPGAKSGTSLILGHVSGWSEPGVFKHVDELKTGSYIEMEMGNGEKLLYEVTRLEQIPVVDLDMGQVLSPQAEGSHDLKLLTCSGKYNRETESYSDRTIVYAKIIR